MVEFLRKWYILVALVGLAGALAMAWAITPSKDHGWLSLILILAPFLVVAIVLATRGFQQTTIFRVAISIYAVFLVPSGLFMWTADVMDNRNNPGSIPTWSNTGFWFSLALELSVILSPVVFGFAAIFTYVHNRIILGIRE